MSALFLEGNELREIIKKNGFKVTRLAAHAGLGKRTLERRFSEQFGDAPKRWIIRERMNLARTLLGKGLSNKEIAAELSYTFESNFCRDFKRFHGYPPQTLVRAGGLPA